MPRVTILGAGSGFTRRLTADIMQIPDIGSGQFALVDIDSERLELAHKIVEKIVELSGHDWTVEASTDRRKVLAGSDYIINTIEVSGVKTVGFDYEIPLKYGVKQCIGDTVGPGGIFKGLRTIPGWLGILKDAEELCPNALVLNYTNPMAMMTLAGLLSSKMQIVGLCHSVQGSSHGLADYLGVPYEELEWQCAGINHMAWFTVLRHKGEDMYPRLLADYEANPAKYEGDMVRMELTKHLGYYVTESTGHMSEYIPYFRKRDDLLEKYLRDGYSGGTGFYATSWPTWRKNCDESIRKQLRGEEDIDLSRSYEYASTIIEAHMFNRPTVIHGNVLNTNSGLIENLPPDACVEVPVMIDRNGYNPCRFGRLPRQCAALNLSNIVEQQLLVEAVLTGDREAAVHALMVDPLTAAVCSPEEIRCMFDELWEAEVEYMPENMR